MSLPAVASYAVKSTGAPKAGGMEADQSKPRERIAFIDTTRGLLFLLMTSAHAALLADLPTTTFFGSEWWLPRTGSFQTFVVLSGFSAALIFAWESQPVASRRRAWKRAGQLLVVMFLSNIIMLLLRYARDGELDRIGDARWWLGLLTLETPYSISIVLLPIAIFLLLAPAAYELCPRYGLVVFGAGVALLALAVWSIPQSFADRVAGYPWLAILLPQSGGSAILPMICNGAMGFACGLCWKRYAGQPGAPLAAAIVVLAALVLSWLPELAPSAALVLLLGPFQWLARFVLFLACGLAITVVWPLARAFAFLPLMGKYALFSFLLHRIVMQLLALLGTTQRPPASAEVAYLEYFVGTLAIITGLCLLRDRWRAGDQFLKRLFL
jgi:uncharacterized membrane protein